MFRCRALANLRAGARSPLILTTDAGSHHHCLCFPAFSAHRPPQLRINSQIIQASREENGIHRILAVVESHIRDMTLGCIACFKVLLSYPRTQYVVPFCL